MFYGRRVYEFMTSLRYGRIFCLEFQKIDGTEYLMGSTELAIFWKIIEPRSLQFGRRI